MHARFERLILLVGLLALLVPLGCSSEPGDGGGGGGQCVIEQPGEPSPGYPFNLGAFKDQIIPALNADCEQCHGVNGPNHDSFVIFAATAQPGNCDYVNTFKEVKAKSDLVTPDNSPIVRAMQGQVTDHPIYDQPKIDVFLTYIRDANATCVANGQCQPSNGIGFDKPTFETVIQPALDRAVGLAGTGCAAALGCHGPPAGTSNFILNANPAPGSAEMDANFTEITSKKVNLTTPENSIFYTKAIAAHGVGQSSVVSAADGAAILAWIKAAQGSAPPPATGCADKTLLNEGVWETEIVTMLKGDLDWNNAGSGQPRTFCAGATCHGNPALPFNLTGTPAESLERFACFVNLDSPSRSPVVVCPATGGGVDCPVSVHPGGRVFVDANDANLRKLLSFLFAAVAGKSPLDFGFYSTKLDPFFNDPNACAEVDLDCADSECHGVQFNGQLPANGSQLPMLQNAGDVNRLKINFASVSNFVNFGDGPTSSLHLYPTDQCVVDTVNCTGTAHGGGVCFNDGDAIDLDIIKWADGLQPNANSTMTDWLVTGDFA